MALYSQAIEIVLEAGEQLINREGIHKISEKGQTDYVTAVDIRVQKTIFQKLSQIDPDMQFLGEEKDNQEIDPEGKVWILDPVDGTTNLIHDFHHSVISLAYSEGGEIQFGIVYDPFSHEMFGARKGKGAYLNKERIFVSKAEKLSQSLISIGTAPGCREDADRAFARMRRVYDKCQDVRRIGSAALELAYVACGRLEGFYEGHLKIWDYAAGKLLVEEAGGIVLADKERVFASAPGIAEEFRCIAEEEEKDI